MVVRTTVLFVAFILTFSLSTQAQDCDVEGGEFEGITSFKCNIGQIQIEEQPTDSISYARLRLNAIPDKNVMGLTLTLRFNDNPLLFQPESTAFALIDGERYEFQVAPDLENKPEELEKRWGLLITPEAIFAIETAEEFRVKLGEAVFDFAPAIETVAYAASELEK